MTNSILLFYLGGICDRALVISITLLVVATIMLLVFINLSFGSSPEYTPAENRECKMKYRKRCSSRTVSMCLTGCGSSRRSDYV